MENQTLVIEFNISKALVIIEKDTDLNAMFREKFGTDYKMCHALINSGEGMKPKAENFIEALFNSVILEKTSLRNAYVKLSDDTTQVEEVVEVVETKVATTNKKKRWGVKAITSDIGEFFNGKGKQIHSTGKQVQELKKIFTRLEMRIFNERFVKQTLTDKELREIMGAIDTLNMKINSIINPKK